MDAGEAALFHLRGAIQGPDFQEEHLARVPVAIAIVLAEIDDNIAIPGFDTTIRAGLAGLGEVILTAGIVLDERSYRLRARTLAQTLIDRYSERENWPTGLPGGGPNPSLMLGTAGIGYWLLRLDQPERLPSLLLVDLVHGENPTAQGNALSG